MSEKKFEVITIHEILKILPHRYPFLMIDKVIQMDLGKTITTVRNITANEPCFMGHFPDNPVFPGVLILEALAQASGVLFFKTNEAEGEDPKKYLYLYAGVDKARFKRVVIPGDELRLHAELVRSRQDVCVFKVTATVEDQIACTAELILARKLKEEDNQTKEA